MWLLLILATFASGIATMFVLGNRELEGELAVLAYSSVAVAVALWGSLAWVLHWAGAESRRQFKRELVRGLVQGGRLIGTGIALVVVLVLIAQQWDQREARNKRYLDWFYSVCGTPVSVEETALRTIRCYRCRSHFAIPVEFHERIEPYGGPSAFAAGVRVCTSKE